MNAPGSSGQSGGGRPHPRWLGLTGGIGSGKSTVAARMVSHGATLVDTDAIARQITGPGGAAMPALIDEFGPQVADATGALDRARMRELAFAQASAKQRLEAILHPRIGEEALRQARAAGTGVVLFDVPLMAESSHWRGRCERILVVDCDALTQVQRVMARSGWTEDQVRAVIAQQSPRDKRRAIADAVIFNDGLTLQGLHAQVDLLWQHWCG